MQCSSCRLVVFGFFVCSAIEISKQIQEDQCVGNEEERQRLRHVATLGGNCDHISHNQNKLDQLNGGHILFPPQVLLVLWTHGGDHVIEIHNDVNARVKNANNNALFT